MYIQTIEQHFDDSISSLSSSLHMIDLLILYIGKQHEISNFNFHVKSLVQTESDSV